MISPVLDDGLGLLWREKDLTIEQFISKLAVEGFTVTIFPRAARSDAGSLCDESDTCLEKVRVRF